MENQNLQNEPDEYDKRLDEFIRRPTFVGQMQAAHKARPKIKLDEMSFTNDLAEHWYIYFLLVFSAVFSGMLGVYMGLAPMRIDNGDLYFHTDSAHLFLSLMYGAGFVLVTEFAFGLGKWLYYTRESKNKWQEISTISIMVIAGISILGTGIAGGIIIASTVDFLTAFVQIPEWAQTWVVRVIPALVVIYSFFLTIYVLSSSKAETYRLIRERAHEHELDHQARQATLDQWAQEEISKAAMKVYIQKVEAGTMTAAQALAEMRAEKSLKAPMQREQQLPRQQSPRQMTQQERPILQQPIRQYNDDTEFQVGDPNSGRRDNHNGQH